MPVCRRCGKQVGSNGFCHDCMSYNDVVEKLDDSDIDRLKINANISPIKRSKVHSNQNNSYKCFYCSQKHTSHDELLAHLTEMHSFKCSYCSKTFTSIEELWRHSYIFHDEVKCHKCSKTFPSVDKLLTHLKQMHLLKCPHCSKTFTSSDKLRLHQINAHRKKK